MTTIQICLNEQKNIIARALLKVSHTLDIPMSQIARIIQLDTLCTKTLMNDASSVLNQHQCRRALLFIGIYEKLYAKYSGDTCLVREFLLHNNHLFIATPLHMCVLDEGLEQVYAQVKAL